MQRYPQGELVVVLDCADLERAAAFWTTVLGYLREGYGGGRYPGLVPQDSRGGVELLLQRTGDRTSGKNRVHLDLRLPTSTSRSRVRAAGGLVLTSEPVVEHGWRWHILGDPDGNELCVLQPPAS